MSFTNGYREGGGKGGPEILILSDLDDARTLFPNGCVISTVRKANVFYIVSYTV